MREREITLDIRFCAFAPNTLADVTVWAGLILPHIHGALFASIVEESMGPSHARDEHHELKGRKRSNNSVERRDGGSFLIQDCVVDAIDPVVRVTLRFVLEI